MREVVINTEFIKLGALLKMADIADSGVHAKIIVLNGEAKVNQEVDLRRGRKVRDGDVVEVEGFEPFKVKVELS